MPVTCLPETLISAYRKTRYRVFTSPDFELAVGQRSNALADLCRLTPERSEDAIRRRIRATVFPGMPGPYIELYGRRFEYVTK